MGYQVFAKASRIILPVVLAISFAIAPAQAVAKTLPLSAASDSQCSRASGSVVDGAPLAETINLSPEPRYAQVVVNFDTKRGLYKGTLIFSADKPLPASVKPENLMLFAEPMLRSGELLETSSFPDPTFGEPKILSNRKRIEFKFCLDSTDLAPGKYSTTITLGGPEGVNSATSSLVANLKAGVAFWISWVIVLALAAAFMALQRRSSTTREKPDRWMFVLSSLVSLGVAGVAMLKIYGSDPAWGASLVDASIALLGAAFAAIGAQNVLQLGLDKAVKERK